MIRVILLSIGVILAMEPDILIGQDASQPPIPTANPNRLETWDENKVILLPKVVVRGPEIPVFSEREIHTKSGMEDLLLKRFPGASFKDQPAWLDNYALLMYSDEVRLEQMDHYRKLADAIRRTGDVAGSDALRADINRTFLRRPTWQTARMDKILNAGRR
jgi:hypothetical protein